MPACAESVQESPPTVGLYTRELLPAEARTKLLGFMQYLQICIVIVVYVQFPRLVKYS